MFPFATSDRKQIVPTEFISSFQNFPDQRNESQARGPMASLSRQGRSSGEPQSWQPFTNGRKSSPPGRPGISSRHVERLADTRDDERPSKAADMDQGQSRSRSTSRGRPSTQARARDPKDYGITPRAHSAPRTPPDGAGNPLSRFVEGPSSSLPQRPLPAPAAHARIAPAAPPSIGILELRAPIDGPGLCTVGLQVRAAARRPPSGPRARRPPARARRAAPRAPVSGRGSLTRRVPPVGQVSPDTPHVIERVSTPPPARGLCPRRTRRLCACRAPRAERPARHRQVSRLVEAGSGKEVTSAVRPGDVLRFVDGFSVDAVPPPPAPHTLRPRAGGRGDAARCVTSPVDCKLAYRFVRRSLAYRFVRRSLAYRFVGRSLVCRLLHRWRVD